MKQWYWVELIGFDNTKADYGVSDYLKSTGDVVTGVSLFVYSSEFINSFSGYDASKTLRDEYCSYAAHPYNEDRARQKWTHFQLKGLVTALKDRGVKVLFSTFSTFIYRDENGEIIVGEWGEKNLKIREFSTVKGGNFGAVSLIKRFESGEYYVDYFAKKVIEIINAFGFDGIHLGDGLGFPIRPLQMGDFSDDLVIRFKQYYNVDLPNDINGECDGDNDLLIKRYRYIFENLRYEYTQFIAYAYGEFSNRLHNALNQSEKIVMGNGCWTRDPFEQLFRYGVDYRELGYQKFDAYVYENMGGSLPIFSVFESGGVEFSNEFRKSVQYFFQLSLLSLKAYNPSCSVISLTPIKDTCEQWNLISNHPNMLKKAIALRNSAFVKLGDKYHKANDGAMYCLSDAVQGSQWSMINETERVTELKNISGVNGYAFLFNDDVKGEVKEYIKTRYLHSFEIRKRLISAGLTFNLAVDVDGLAGVSVPLVCVNIENYSKDDVKKIENYKGIVAVVSRGKTLSKPACATVKLQNSDLVCNVYNLPQKIQPITVENSNEKTDVTAYDEHDGIWTAKLKFEHVNKKFFSEIVSILDRYCSVPKVTRGDARVNAYKIGDKKWRVYVYNCSPHIDVIFVKFPFKVAKAKSLFAEVNLKRIVGDEINVKIANDGIEVVEVTEE